MHSPIRPLSLGSSTDSSSSINVQILDLIPGNPEQDHIVNKNALQSRNGTSNDTGQDAGSGAGVIPRTISINNKRHWTVARTLGERQGEDGREHEVVWAKTRVAGHQVKYDKRKRPYVEAAGERYYLAKESTAFMDDDGKVWWDCVWENSFITADLLDEIQHFPSEEPPSPEPGPPLALQSTKSALSPRRSIETQDAATGSRQPKAISAITFSGLQRGYPDDLRFQATSSFIDYGPGIHALIERELGKTLTTGRGVAPPTVQRRIEGAIVRPLQIRDFFINRRRHYVNLRLVQNAEAALVHMKGDDVLEPCLRCAGGKGIFQGCIVGDDTFGSGGCTNCHYGSLGNRCSFRTDTNDERGHIPARRIVKDVARRKKSKLRKANHERQSSPISAETSHLSTPASSDFITPSSGPSSGFQMSGGLGRRSEAPLSSDPDPPPSALARLHDRLTIRKRQRSSSFEDHERDVSGDRGEHDDPASEIPTTSGPSAPSSSDLRLIKRSASVISSPFQPSAEPAIAPGSLASKVYRTDRFAPGTLREDQLQYIYSQCDDDEKSIIKRRFQGAKASGKVSANMTFTEFYSVHEGKWLRRTIIKRVCRGKKTVDLEEE